MVVYTDPAAEDEGDLDSLPDGNYGAHTLEENERIHFCDLKDRYRQRRDCLNSHKKHTKLEVRLLAQRLSKEDIRKLSIVSSKPSLLHFATSRRR